MSESRDFAALKFANKDEARAWLSKRYASQCQLYPLTARIPEALYVRRNLPEAMKMTQPEPDYSMMDHCVSCGHVRDLGNLGLCSPCFETHIDKLWIATA